MHVTVFSECQLAGTRQSVSLPSVKWPALGKKIFRRVPVVRRVHVVWHSAKNLALGIRGFSGSVWHTRNNLIAKRKGGVFLDYTMKYAVG